MTLHLVVIGDIHAQRAKFWTMLQKAQLCDAERQPAPGLLDGTVRLILLGDLIHAKSRDRYAQLADVERFDEFDPEHINLAEAAQEAFLTDVKAFHDALPDEAMTILMGNHDFNAVHPEQSPLRTDDVTHLEWKSGYGGELPQELRAWILAWPHEHVVSGLHFAHVGPFEKHNTYDNAFYLENRRRWIYEERDFMADTPYRLGVYGHTPVRGGVNIASQGRAILLDTNGYQDEHCWLEIEVSEGAYRLRMQGLFFDEWVER